MEVPFGTDPNLYLDTIPSHVVMRDKVSFYWKVSSQESSDYLEFYIDGNLQTSISGEIDWQKKSYSLSAGSRTLKWRYVKNESSYEGEDTGWVDGLYAGPSSGS